MNKVTRILAVLDGTGEDAVVLDKAVALADQQRASLELFLCDAQSAYSLQHSYDQTDVEAFRCKSLRDSRRYLNSLRDVAVKADVPITVDAACESPLYEAIVRKVMRSRADFVIKSAATSDPSRRFALDANDWQLIRACPATLLMSRGKSWRLAPKFAAAVDMSGEETSGLPANIVQISVDILRGCKGRLDIVYSEPEGTHGAEHQKRLEKLRALNSFAGIPGAEVHVLRGHPEEALPPFTAARAYDAVVMGALTHRKSLSALVGTLTSKLVDCLDCDFVLVKPDTYRTTVELTDTLVNYSLDEPEAESFPQPPSATPGFVSPWQLPARAD
jgi:universal stress protein E